jgi:hypothetical protein
LCVLRALAPLPLPLTSARVYLQRVLQYVLRFIFYLRRHRISSSLLARLLAVVSTLSAMRRLVALIDLSGHLYRSCDPFRVLHPSKQDKGKAKEGTLITPPPRHPQWQLDPLLHLLRQTLDLTSTVADNVFLLARLHLLPLSTRATHHADRIADYATLLSSGMGLLQVAHSRRQIWAEGRAVRRGAIRLEERLETYEYWEGGEEKVAEEKRLRERVRNERRKLKKLREELNELWWERLRLFAEAVFSSAFVSSWMRDRDEGARELTSFLAHRSFAAYDVLELQAGSEAIKSWAGLTSAGIM